MHWNVTGINFPVYHRFFAKIYEEVYAAIDPFAEQIRAVDQFAPSIRQCLEQSTLPESEELSGSKEFLMLKELDICNELVLKSLNIAFDEATAAKEQGLADFIAARLDAHRKHGWMIKSCMK
jgi:starvation-inducible DNA-binding protein